MIGYPRHCWSVAREEISNQRIWPRLRGIPVPSLRATGSGDLLVRVTPARPHRSGMPRSGETKQQLGTSSQRNQRERGDDLFVVLYLYPMCI